MTDASRLDALNDQVVEWDASLGAGRSLRLPSAPRVGRARVRLDPLRRCAPRCRSDRGAHAVDVRRPADRAGPGCGRSSGRLTDRAGGFDGIRGISRRNVRRHEAVDDDQLLGRLPCGRRQGRRAREGRARRRVGARGVQLRRRVADGIPGREDLDDRDRLGDPERVLPNRDLHGADGSGSRLRVGRSVHPRSRCVGPAGDRRVPRRGLRQADAAHPRLHQRVPDDLASREGRLRRPDRQDPVARGRGHGPRQAAEADQPSGA